MSEIFLSNNKLRVKLNTHGAELRSVVGKSGHEYMWQADPAYWDRTSPVLFPLVGAVKNHQYRYDGQTWQMKSHGFARDMEFDLVSADADKAVFCLKENEDTLKIYPFRFGLKITYILKDNELTVVWEVKNSNDKTMYFSIGAHPAFNMPLDAAGTFAGCYVGFNASGTLVTRDFKQGLALKSTKERKLDDMGRYIIDEHTFDNDVLIFEDRQANSVSLIDREGKPIVTLGFDMPLFGVWSPPHKNAPFICVEPWCGRADIEDFEGELPEREYGQSLKAGEAFTAEYKITFH